MKRVLKITGVMVLLLASLNVSTNVINTKNVSSKSKNSIAVTNNIPSEKICIDPDSKI